MGILARLEDNIDGSGLTTVLLSVFLFLQPFHKFSGVRNAAFVLLLLALLVKLARRGLKFDFKDLTVIGFVLLVGAALVSAALSPYPLDSLDALRKNLLYQAVVFFAIISGYRGGEGLKPLIYALLAGFAALSVFVVLKYNHEVFLNWLEHSDKGDAPFLKGYSLYATFYIPLAAAYLYASKEGAAFKAALVFFIFLEFTLSVLNNHRTQIIAIVLSAGLVTIAARRFKVLLGGAVICVVAGAAIYQANPGSFDRYKTLLNPNNYLSNAHEGLNDRVAIWQGTSDMIKDRPITGWGYGWKKIALVANEKGYLERWDKEGRTYIYFKEKGYGAANPHNLVLQILFEVGALGLLAFLFFWGTIVYKAFSARGRETEGKSLLKYGVAGVLFSYLIINYTNGLWEESFGVLMVSFAASCVVLYREAKSVETVSA